MRMKIFLTRYIEIRSISIAYCFVGQRQQKSKKVTFLFWEVIVVLYRLLKGQKIMIYDMSYI